MPYRKQVIVEQGNTTVLPVEAKEIPPMPTFTIFGRIKPFLLQCDECGEYTSSYGSKKKTESTVLWKCSHCGATTETLNWKETLKKIEERRLWNRLCKWFKENL